MNSYIGNMPYVSCMERKHKRAAIRRRVLLLLGCVLVLASTFQVNTDNPQKISLSNRG